MLPLTATVEIKYLCSSLSHLDHFIAYLLHRKTQRCPQPAAASLSEIHCVCLASQLKLCPNSSCFHFDMVGILHYLLHSLSCVLSVPEHLEEGSIQSVTVVTHPPPYIVWGCE